jgi:hypothetical protein
MLSSVVETCQTLGIEFSSDYTYYKYIRNHIRILKLLLNTVSGFIVAYGLATIRGLCFPCARALLTKLVKPEEVPKMYGFLNMITMALNLSEIPLFRFVYDEYIRVNKTQLNPNWLTCSRIHL